MYVGQVRIDLEREYYTHSGCPVPDHNRPVMLGGYTISALLTYSNQRPSYREPEKNEMMILLSRLFHFINQNDRHDHFAFCFINAGDAFLFYDSQSPTVLSAGGWTILKSLTRACHSVNENMLVHRKDVQRQCWVLLSATRGCPSPTFIGVITGSNAIQQCN